MELTAVRNLFPELSSCNGADDGRNDFIQFPCSLWIRTVQIQGQKHFIYDPSCDNDDSVGCYYDPAVHGIQSLRMDQHPAAADCSDLVRIGLLCIPDETVPHGNTKRL